MPTPAPEPPAASETDAALQTILTRRSSCLAPDWHFRVSTDASPVLIALTDENGRAFYYNAACVAFCKASSMEALLDGGWLDCVHPEDRAGLIAHYQEAIPRKAPFVLEYRAIRHDGQVRTLLNASAPYFEPQSGRHAGYIISATDVTEQKQAVRSYLHVRDANVIGIVTTDSTGRIFAANDAFLSSVGYTRNDLEAGSLNWRRLTPESFQATDEAALQEIQRAGICQPYEKQYTHRQGHPVDVLLWMTLQESQPESLMAFVLDITERKRIERELQRNVAWESLRRQVLEITGQSLDLPFILKVVAEAVGGFYGVDRCVLSAYQPNGDEPLVTSHLPVYMEQYCARPNIRPVALHHVSEWLPFCDFNDPDSRKPLIIPSRNAFLDLLNHRLGALPLSENQKALCLRKLEEEVLDHYGIRSVLHLSIQYRGRAYGAICLQQCGFEREWTPLETQQLSDIAQHIGSLIYQSGLHKQEQAVRQKLEHSNQELEQFATVASHDLQAPLRKVILFSDYLVQAAGNQLSPECLDYIDRIHKSTLKMQTLVSDLLALSRVTRQGKAFEPISLATVAQEVTADLEEYLKAAEGRVTVENDVTVEADAVQIYQLFQNLIVNGVKFRRADTPPQVLVRLESLDDQRCRITIQDNGIGFDEKYAERVFAVFERLHGDHEYEGNGMGLAIVQKIVQRHGGEITTHSRPQEGATFVILLPVRQSQARPASASALSWTTR